MMTTKSTATIEQAAREAFGWPSLRPGQAEAIQGLLAGRDVLAVMPTGYGKSAIYQVAATLIDGPTVVVSPLISLQADQVASIDEHEGAPAAVAVNSGQGDRANADAWRAISRHGAEYLFLSPEQLAKDDVVGKLKAAGVRLFVVDEAHCVSAWGHDFRPDYLRLAEVIGRLGTPQVLALTATGSPPVREEILERLRLRDPLVLTRGFDRPNLRLEVSVHADDALKRRAVIDQVSALPKPGLVYVSTRRDTERYAEALRAQGLRAAAYHGALKAAERRAVHEDFHEDRCDVVVATSAFGMGIDKSNVRFFVHAAVTDSLDSYYQEAGRAGRDGEAALAMLHYRAQDLGLRTFFASGAPDEEELARVFAAIAEAGAPVRLRSLGEQLGLGTRTLSRLVNLLEEAGMVSSGRRGVRESTASSAADAARRALEAAEERERIDLSRIAMMRSYAETRQCRRQFLLGYFGEDLPEPCGNCDNCTSGTARDTATADQGEEPFPAESPVRHSEWGPGTVIRTEDDRITVFFESQGYKVLSRQAVLEGDLLEPA